MHLMQDKNIKYVLPFENKGEEIGVTLEHPHGQIYAMSMIPEIINRQAINQKEKNIVRTMSNKPPNCFTVSGKSLILFK